jgi:hypothetical protein
MLSAQPAAALLGRFQGAAAASWNKIAALSSQAKPAPLTVSYRSAVQETYVTRYQANLADFWEGHKDQLLSSFPSLTTEKFLHARALLATRLFGLQVGASMVPLLDVANHVSEHTSK